MQIINNDALRVLKTLPDECCRTCITSPPYFRLRDYGVEGQIGLEDSLDEYIAKLVEVFREVKRVLAKDGTLWLNISDSYAGTSKGRGSDGVYGKNKGKQSSGQRKGILPASPTYADIKRKDLYGVPWMLAFALRTDGWYLRSDIIWQKPNCMPESVKDRPTRAHEYIFLLSKSAKYYYDAESVMEDAVGFNNIAPAGSKGTFTPNSRRRKGNAKTFRGSGAYTNNQSFNNNATVERQSHGNNPNESGKRNRRTVWTVATKGCKEAHFATFPEELIRPCILAGSQKGNIVIDTFAGSGTTGVVAAQEGRDFIGIELNKEYCKIIEKRLADVRAMKGGE